jgi:hypothetical protein
MVAIEEDATMEEDHADDEQGEGYDYGNCCGGSYAGWCV